MGTVLLISSMDTRQEEILYLKGLIEGRGCKVLILDISMSTYTGDFGGYSCIAVAEAAGVFFHEVAESRDTNKNMVLMVKGAVAIARDLFQKGRIDGIAGLGGTSNITIVSLVMKELPFGFPKLILTSSAAMPSLAHRFFADTDIAIFHSCVSINGLNSFVRDALKRFAGMITGCVTTGRPHGLRDQRKAALTEFKFSSHCAGRVRKLLEETGLEVVSFSATGAGDRIMEDMASEGYFKGILDIVPSGFSEALLGGNRSAGLDRLDKELRLGIPVILTPCGFDMISCGPYERKDTDPFWKTRRIEERKLFIPDKFRVQARTSKGEMEIIAVAFAEKLERARGKAIVCIPLRGFSSLSQPGGPLWDPEADRLFVRTLRDAIKGGDGVEIVELDYAIDDPPFADYLVARFIEEVRGEE